MTLEQNTKYIDDEDPNDIADDLLYRTGQAMLQNDFDAFQACFKIPQLVETSEGKRLVETIDEFRVVFLNMQENLRERCVVDVVRSVVSAEFLEKDVIGSTHVAVRIDADGNKMCPPYPVYSILRRDSNNVWRIESSIYAFVEDFEMNMIFHRKNTSIET